MGRVLPVARVRRSHSRLDAPAAVGLDLPVESALRPLLRVETGRSRLPRIGFSSH